MPDLYPLARRFMFTLDAEIAHRLGMSALRTGQSLGLIRFLFGSKGSLSFDPIEVMGLRFPNRVGLAAGLDKAAECVTAFGELGFGHVEVGTVTPRPQPGNDKPRLFRLVPQGAIINRMGFNNPGVAGLLENLERSRRGFAGVLGINIGKNFDTPLENATRDYLICLEGVYAAADYVTVNLSSPNTKGLRDLQNSEVCRRLILDLQEMRETLVKEHDGKYVPLLIKIAPDLDEAAIDSLGHVFNETMIDGVIATNTTITRDGVAGHPRSQETGGLSGAALTERSTAVLARLRSGLDSAIPLIGSGGVMSAADAQAKFDAGASLVQVFTGLIYSGPRLIREIASLRVGGSETV